MPNFSTIKGYISKNLDDTGNIFYTTTNVDNSIQDAYDDVAVLTQCIVKKATVNFTTDPYYDFKQLGISDFLAATAIFNQNTNRWLQDNITIRDLDLMRDDWELWNGTPNWWAAANFKYTVIMPKYSTVPLLPMDLYYWATAPTVFDINVPLIPTDIHDLIEDYSTADLLEQAEEYTKANAYWKDYFDNIEVCSQRLKNIASADLLRLA